MRLAIHCLAAALALPAAGRDETAQPAMAEIEIVQTSRSGDRLEPVSPASNREPDIVLTLDRSERHQTLVGIGGSFTESSGAVLCELSNEQQQALVEAYFSPEGSHYSLTRTHIASCDFSVTNYSYAPVPGDTALEHFSIEPDRKFLLPLIEAAHRVPGADFKIIASPWTAPPWMKDNNTWNGGKLKPEHYATFADYFVRYLEAYRELGYDVWGITPTNEPLGNGENWESLHWSPEEMAAFIGEHLGPALEDAGLDVTLWAYDQNREHELEEWADVILGDEQAARYTDGMAVHWYQSTVDVGAEALDYVSGKFPDKPLLHSEGCIDAMGDDEPIGAWLEDDWYWRPEATDWGYIWAPEEQKKDHPKYRPFHRYARDLVEGLNHNLVGWVDWNLILNTRGGPNHARNFCLAPVLVDSGRDHVYYTPLYYAVAHFSKYFRPGAVRIGLNGATGSLLATAFENPDGSIAVGVFNTAEEPAIYRLKLDGANWDIPIAAQGLQTVVVRP